MGSVPGQVTKVPRVMGQLSSHATTTELKHHNEMQQRRSKMQLRLNMTK